LAIEEQFYLVWPLAVATLGPAGLKRLCVVTLAVATPARFASLAAIGTYAPYYLTWCKLDALVAGAWLAVALRGPAPDVALKRAGRLGVVCFASLAAWFVASGNLFCFDPVVSTLAPPLVAGACVGVVATAVAPSPFVSRVLTWRPLAELGRVSYGVYVFHGLLQIVFLRTLGDIAVTAGNYWTTWLVFMAFTVGVSYLLARASFVIESRFLRLKRHFVFDGPPRLGQAATTAG
ncbi:MAG: acyltransferase family protein, partial [Planctomycetota bacterium]